MVARPTTDAVADYIGTGAVEACRGARLALPAVRVLVVVHGAAVSDTSTCFKELPHYAGSATDRRLFARLTPGARHTRLKVELLDEPVRAMAVSSPGAGAATLLGAIETKFHIHRVKAKLPRQAAAIRQAGYAGLAVVLFT